LNVQKALNRMDREEE